MVDIGLVAEALEAFEWLAKVLATLKGRPQGAGAVEKLDGFGGLAHRTAQPPLRDTLQASVNAGDSAGLMRTWVTLMSEEPEVARTSAVIFRRWGWEAIEGGDLESGEAWLVRSLGLFERLVHEGDGPLTSPGRAFGAVFAQARSQLMGHLLAEHAQAALAAIETRRWELASLHWRLTTSRDSGSHHLDALVGGLLAQASALEHAGAARGIGDGDLSSLRLLALGLRLAPQASALHIRRVEVGVKAALTLFGLGELEAMAAVAEQLEPTLTWFADNPSPDEGIFFERLAESHVVCAAVSEHPRHASAHLRRALELNPHHPTAQTLLAEALAALAARRFGAGALEEARALAGEAALHLEPSEAFDRLQSALAKAR